MRKRSVYCAGLLTGFVFASFFFINFHYSCAITKGDDTADFRMHTSSASANLQKDASSSVSSKNNSSNKKPDLRKTERMAKLRLVFSKFDMDSSGKIDVEEMYALGKERRKLKHKTSEWTRGKTVNLFRRMGAPTNEASRDQFVSYFLANLAGSDDKAFSSTIEQFLTEAETLDAVRGFMEDFINSDEGAEKTTKDTSIKDEPVVQKDLRLESKTSTPPQDRGIGDSCDKDPNDIDCSIHFIFSSSCNKFQHWQSELVLFSHWQSGQKGKITRIVSGCDESHALGNDNLAAGKLTSNVDIETLRKSSHPNFILHVTPTFKEAEIFSWFNKPLGIQNWVDHGKHDKNGTVILLDPDMPLLEPITQHPMEAKRLLFDPSTKAEFGMNVARRKRPVAAKYGIGFGWKNYDRKKICGENSPCTKVKEPEADLHYSVGPPIIWKFQDLVDITKLWYPYMKPVFKQTPDDMINDMWAYSMATANLEMPHTTLVNLMVSNPYSDDPYQFEEAWAYIAKTKTMSCDNPKKPDNVDLWPSVLHLAQFYSARDEGSGELWMFQKGHVPHNILDCDIPLLKAPPDDFFNKMTTHRTRQHAWAICVATATTNNMLTAYKKKHCAGKMNLKKIVRLVKDKECQYNKEVSCCNEESSDKLCWPIAEIEATLEEDMAVPVKDRKLKHRSKEEYMKSLKCDNGYRKMPGMDVDGLKNAGLCPEHNNCEFDSLSEAKNMCQTKRACMAVLERSAKRFSLMSSGAAKKSKNPNINTHLKCGPQKCVEGWKEMKGRVIYGCTKEHACENYKTFAQAEKACREQEDCKGIIEVIDDLHYETRAADVGLSEDENAFIRC